MRDSTTAKVLLAWTMRAGALAAAGAVLAGGAGCARTMIAETLATNYAAGEVEQELAYWHTLPTRSAVANDEGLHGLFLLADGDDPSGSYEARVEGAKARGWIPAGFDEPAGMAMQRGTLAMAVAVICEIRGGVVMRALGPSPRYAVRELTYLRLMPENSTELQTLTGLEYVGVISKAQDYLVLNKIPFGVAKSDKVGAEPAPPPTNPADPTDPLAPSVPSPRER